MVINPCAVESPWHLLALCHAEEDLFYALAERLRVRFQARASDLFLTEERGHWILKASTDRPEHVQRLFFRVDPGTGRHNPIELPPLGYFTCHRSKPQRQLFLDEGAEWGFIRLIYERGDPIPLLDRELKRTVQEAGMVIRAFQHVYELGAQSSKLGALSQVTRTIVGTPYLEEILQLLVNITAQQFNYKVVTVRLLDERQRELILRATQATNKAYQRKRAIKLGESIAGRAISEMRPIIVDDVQAESEYIGHDLAEAQGLRSMICIPLTLGNRALGVISCYTGEQHEFEDDEIAALETLGKQAAVSIEHAKLQVRNTLMQEMHHRVKNNLQQVASLLRLQLRQSHYQSLDQAINDSLARILAIASVHELLSRDDLDHVGIKSIAELLVQHTQQSFIPPDKTIRFSVRGDDVTLAINQATNIALILNELILNAVEHGFEQASDGEIHINVEDRDGMIGVWVSNNGDPLPGDFDMIQGQLGLQIVDRLARSLGGPITIEDRLGWTVCELLFPRTQGE